MAIIITEGIARDIKNLESGLTAFSLCENTGNKETPNYVYYDCITKLSEKQKQYLTNNKIVKVVGDFSSKKTTKDEKTYINLSIYIYNLEFRGEIKSENEKD